ncbi:hypothetical protein SDC9_168393 [bioreactor metagenome]|uniref:Uncharacterized protein n=1 Tax=bioreactor metagenome TaxID=1076179 RepID=A0A645GAB5_9ZZZZ
MGRAAQGGAGRGEQIVQGRQAGAEHGGAPGQGGSVGPDGGLAGLRWRSAGKVVVAVVEVAGHVGFVVREPVQVVARDAQGDPLQQLGTVGDHPPRLGVDGAGIAAVHAFVAAGAGGVVQLLAMLGVGVIDGIAERRAR